TWHLAYAWMPWCFFLYERARTRRLFAAPGAYAAAATSIAMLVYAGGIYPLPHTAMALGLYALLLAAFERSTRPLGTLAICAALGIGLAAPKLLPIVEGFRKVPRLVDSSESLTLEAFWTLLTSRDQAFYSRPARVSPYGWHEWGMYISVAGAVLL